MSSDPVFPAAPGGLAWTVADRELLALFAESQNKDQRAATFTADLGIQSGFAFTWDPERDLYGLVHRDLAGTVDGLWALGRGPAGSGADAPAPITLYDDVPPAALRDLWWECVRREIPALADARRKGLTPHVTLEEVGAITWARSATSVIWTTSAPDVPGSVALYYTVLHDRWSGRRPVEGIVFGTTLAEAVSDLVELSRVTRRHGLSLEVHDHIGCARPALLDALHVWDEPVPVQS